MPESGTIILTSSKPDIAAALEDYHAVVGLRIIGEQPPAARIDGRIWCFVDWLLPEISGLEMCRRLRENPATAQSQIIMILDENDLEARRRALRAGADDYLIGPLTAEAVLGRLQQYRAGSVAAHSATRLVHGDLTADVATQQARWQGRPVPMSPNEFHLLVHFIEHPDQVFSRSSLIELLGKESEAIDERTVDVWVGRLRRALKAQGAPDLLRTVRSLGYVLDGIYEA